MPFVSSGTKTMFSGFLTQQTCMYGRNGFGGRIGDYCTWKRSPLMHSVYGEESGLWRVRALKLWVLGGASEGFVE